MPLPTELSMETGQPAAKPDEGPARPVTLSCRLRQLRKVLKTVIGAPNYEAYLDHRRAVHPGEPVMSEAEFFRYAIDRRFNKRGGGMRCC